MKKMSPNHIKALLEKYLEGKTSLEEEEVLIEFFQSDEVPLELEHYKAEFGHYAQSRLDEPGDIVQNAIDSLGMDTSRKSRFYASPWYRVAATLLLIAVSFFAGYSINVKSDLKQEVQSLQNQLFDLQETTVNVMLQGASSHQRIQALVMASQIPTVTDELLNSVLATFNEDDSPIVRSVALEFLGMHKDVESVRIGLINSLLSQNVLSIQIELLWLIEELDDEALRDRLIQLLNNEEVDAELKEEIKKIIQNDKTQST